MPKLVFDYAKLHAGAFQLTAQKCAHRLLRFQDRAAFRGLFSPHLIKHWLRHVLLISGSSGHKIMKFWTEAISRYLC